MKKFNLFLVCLLSMGIWSATAQEDVTGTYLSNADFEINPTGFAADNTVYDVPGWTEVPAAAGINYHKLGTVAYGAVTGAVGTVPSNGSSVVESNTSLLGIKLHWSPNTDIYVEQTISLPAGKYTLTWDSYVVQNVSNQASRCGYVIDGTATYDALPAAVGTWKNHSLEFQINTGKDVTIRIGYYKTANAGGGDSPIFFADNVKLYYTYVDLRPILQADLQSVIDDCNALKGITDENTDADVLAAFTTAITNAVSVKDNATTPGELETAIATLQEAEQTYILAAQPNRNCFLDYTFKITNPDFEQSDGTNHPGWTNESGIGTFSAANTVYTGAPNPNKVADNAINGSLSQTISGLPVGVYQVKAVARGASNAEMYIEASIGSWQSENTVSVQVNAIGDQGGDLNYGWNRYTTPQILKQANEDLVIGERRVSGGWRSTDAYELVYLGAGYKVSFDDGSTVSSIIVLANGDKKVTAPEANPTKLGYSFDGWYADSEFTIAFDFETAITSDTIIYAKWEGPKFTLTKLIVDATALLEADDVTENGNTYLTAQIADAQTVVDDADATEDAAIGAVAALETAIAVFHDADLYYLRIGGKAVPGFSATTTGYTLYIAPDIDAPAVDSTSVSAAATVAIDGGTVTVTAGDGTTQTYTVEFVVNYLYGWDGNGINTITDIPSDFGWACTDEKVTWSTAEGDNYLYRYRDDLGSGVGRALTHPVNNSVFSFPVTLTGRKIYQFTCRNSNMNNASVSTLFGFNTANDATGLMLGSQTLTSPQWTATITFDFNFGTPEAGAYYMVWQTTKGADRNLATDFLLVELSDAFVVTFDLGGATAVIAPQYLLPDSVAVQPADPVWFGYAFRGWYTDNTYATAYDFSAPVTGDITVYAWWEATSAVISASRPALAFDQNNLSATFTVLAANLPDGGASISAEPASFTFTSGEETITGISNGETNITVTYTGDIFPASGRIIISDGADAADTINVAVANEIFTPHENNLIPGNGYLNSFDGFAGGWGTKSIVSVLDEPDSIYSGIACAKIAGAALGYPNGGSIDISITWKPNTLYRLRAMVKTIDGDFNIGAGKTYVDGVEAKNFKIAHTNGEWVQFDTTFLTGAAAATGVLYFNNDAGSTGKMAYLDNYELYESGDVVRLEGLITDATALLTGATEAGTSYLNTAIASAQAVADNVDANDTTVIAAINALTAAIMAFHDASLSALQVNGTDIPGFSSEVYDYIYYIVPGTEVTVTATATSAAATVDVSENKVTVTAGDGTSIAEYTVSTVNKHTVTFDLGGATAVIAPQYLLPDSVAVQPADPLWEGHTFIGWFTDNTYATAYDFAAPVTGDITVYAKWETETGLYTAADELVATEYYTLQGQKVAKPAVKCVYIVRKTYASSRVLVEKVFF